MTKYLILFLFSLTSGCGLLSNGGKLSLTGAPEYLQAEYRTQQAFLAYHRLCEPTPVVPEMLKVCQQLQDVVGGAEAILGLVEREAP